MPRQAKKLTKSTLDSLRKKAQEDPKFTSYVADAGQPGLYAWARRGKVDLVFAYRPPAGGRRNRIKIDRYGAITLDKAPGDCPELERPGSGPERSPGREKGGVPSVHYCGAGSPEVS